MDEYISREEAIDKMRSLKSRFRAKNDWDSGYDTAIAEAFEHIKRVPVADVQPVKHGRWEEIEEYGGWGDTYFRCSICGDEWDLDAGTPVENGMKYCPNCGARMNLKDGDEE